MKKKLPIKCPIFKKCNGPRWDCLGSCRFEKECMYMVKHPAKKETKK